MNAMHRFTTTLVLLAALATAGCDGSGIKIVFSSDRDGDDEIFMMNEDGTGVVQLTHNGDSDHGPVYSEDGSKIAFASDRDGNWEVYIMNSDGSDPQRLTKHDDDDYPCSINVAKNTILFWTDRDGNFEIYSMDLEGLNQQNLTNDPADDREGTLSPDGNWIAFTSNRAAGNYDVWIMEHDGNNPQRLTDDAATDQTPAFSPDSARIAFATARDGNGEIYMMGIDGLVETRITFSDGNHAGRPAFRNDGNVVTYILIDQAFQPDVWTMKADGTNQLDITPVPSWDDFPTFAGSL